MRQICRGPIFGCRIGLGFSLTAQLAATGVYVHDPSTTPPSSVMFPDVFFPPFYRMSTFAKSSARAMYWLS